MPWVLITIILILNFYGCQRDLSPKERAFELVKNSYALGDEHTVEQVIEEWIDYKKEDVKTIGWKVKQGKDNIYIVSYHYMIYSFEKGTGERAFSFEVNLDTESVKDITKQVEEQMMPLEKPFQDEKEISEELLKEFGENGGL